jgi:F-type H+-transporting ATPase subunit epsilon
MRAEEILSDKTSRVDYATAENDLFQAVMQLRTLERFRKRGG